MSKSDKSLIKVTGSHGPSGLYFFVAYIGAVVYFYQQSPGFWGLIVALAKALVWPALVLYHVLGTLNV